jgi:hypothetical protein
MSGGRKHKVHVLSKDRVALCGDPHGLPRTWPYGHKWVPIPDARDATCQECIAIAKKLPKELT